MSTRDRPLRRAILALALALSLPVSPGCHLDMYDQPKDKPLAAEPFFADGSSARPLVAGTVARGSLIADAYRATGKEGGRPGAGFPFAITDSIMARGRDRFDTFCSPCHGRLADGDGMIVRRGFPRPPSLLADSIRREPEGFFYDAITSGFGRMYSYAPSIPVDERWAIVAYLRALQFSQDATLQEIPGSDSRHFGGGSR